MKNSLPLFRFAGCFALIAAVAFAQKTNPKPIAMPSPAYPEALTDSGMNGAAEVDAIVKADGTVAGPELAMATHRAFGKAAMTAVVGWKFEPATVDGAPVDRKVSIPFRFTAPLDQQINSIAKRKVFLALTEPALTQKDFGGKLKVKKPARPVYPRALANSDTEEKVTVKFVIAPDGNTLNPEVVGAKHKEFEIPAMQAVALMSYEPPLKDGKGVYVETTTILNFANERPDFGGGGGGGRGGRGGGGRGGGGGGGGDFGEPPGGN